MSKHEADPAGETSLQYVSMTSLNRAIAANRPRRMLGTMVMAGIAALVSVIALTHTPDPGAIERQQSARACLQWHAGAGTVVSRLVQSTRDTDLQQVSGSVDRMRRARQNCEAGLLAQACQDYHAVAASVPGHVLAGEWFPCARYAQSAGPN
ncbi:MAG TPA: hypothetical protein VFB68_15335 [Xanthobacteraceae bacterium]|nr:hypothetical protein [Xanthobacteraceae bacterium]